MLTLERCHMAAGVTHLDGLTVRFDAGLHLLHFENRALLRLWAESLTGIHALPSGTISTNGRPIGVIYPRALPGEGSPLSRLHSLLETHTCGAALLIDVPLPATEDLAPLYQLCRKDDVPLLHCILSHPPDSTVYDHIWQVKSETLLHVR